LEIFSSFSDLPLTNIFEGRQPTKFDLAVEEITASLKKTTLKEPLTLDAIHSLVWDRENKTPFNCGAGLIDSFDLQFPLCSRETSLQVLSEVMQHHLSSSEKGRKNHPLPVLAGTPDIGKVFFFFSLQHFVPPKFKCPSLSLFCKTDKTPSRSIAESVGTSFEKQSPFSSTCRPNSCHLSKWPWTTKR
jgi:hypothetical protein